MSRHQLTRDYLRVFRDTYVRAGTTLDARALAVAASVCVGDGAVIAGTSAAAVHGARWIDPTIPPSVLADRRSHQLPGLRIHQDAFDTDDVMAIGGFAVSTPVRTGFDLGRWVPPPLSVVFLDSLLAATGVDAEAIRAYGRQRPGTRGIRQLSRALDVVDGGAESPQETRTRLLLVGAGLPKPETQIVIRDSSGRFVARIDMGWQRWRVGVEYEGVHYWLEERQRTRDIERFEALERCEWQIVRVNSEQMRLRPHDVVARVRAKLRAAGAPV
ncbi:endonuclease domain-containing protein [Rhodococcus sp. NPDC078407]|uniref:endonuclease domain-containing protein n=1 Tax=Rhodococcus sp. NPDC078407 TaxID=3364509 RepID=UPI0037C78015